MRKCPSCGSLLLGEVATCARCGTVLPATPAPWAAPTPPAPTPPAVGGPSQVPSYGRLSIPSPIGAPATVGGPVAPPSPPPGFGEWQPVDITVAEPPPRTTRLGLIALLVAVTIVGGLAAMHLRSDPLPKGTSAFVAGEGVTYTAPDGSFQVQVPQTPTTDQRALTLNGVQTTVYAAAVVNPTYAMVAASIQVPFQLSAATTNASLDSALTAWNNSTNGKLVRKNLMMRGPLPAIEGQFTDPDGASVHILVVASASTFVLLAVAAKSGTERLYKAFETSLIMR